MFPVEDLMKNNNDTGDIVDHNTGTNTNNNRLSRWHHNSSRIIRVSRASGGKDRHSKVWTSKGARDRRVRLSVSTALQFYDLQDRLGYDQPSKAIEWLIKAAEESISELPSLNTSNFPMIDGGEEEPNQTGTGLGVSKSACSSNSDTSKNSSGLSLSRSELRDKARERARERTAKERDHSTTSFTDLLNSGSDPVNVNREWMVQSQTQAQAPSSSSPMEYFSSGLILGSSSHPFGTHHQHQEFAFVPDHLISPVGSNGGGGGGGGGFNLDFNMSTNSSVVSGTGATVVSGGGGYNGFNRGTLQSNSSTNHHQNQNQSFLANLQSGGGGAQFLFGALPVENHHPNHNHNHQFQLYCENNKGKGKN